MYLKDIFNAFPDAIFIHDGDSGLIVDVNRSMSRMYGYDKNEVLGSDFSKFSSGEYPYIAEEFSELINRAKSEGVQTFNWQSLSREGKVFWSEINISFSKISGESRFIVLVRDITQRKESEEESERLRSQIEQSSKMESIGLLAGGIAHDFNNMLSVILSNAQLGIRKTEEESKIYKNFDKILRAARRSSNLIQQLLSFARKQSISPVVMDVNVKINDMLSMLDPLVGENIDINWIPGDGKMRILMDLSQFDQLITNLFANSRDSIKGNGLITIKSESINLVYDDHSKFINNENVEYHNGTFVVITVSDNGSGIAKEHIGSIFEPFYTTKELGRGTGLGLSTVYGVIKQNGGFIEVESEVNKGTTIKLYIPEAGTNEQLDEKNEVENKKEQNTKSNHHRILLVEDEKMMRDVTVSMLEYLGFEVVSTLDYDEAISIMESEQDKISLLITDVIMPKGNGFDLSKKIKEINPAIKVLFMSGYSENVISEHGIIDENINFIKKPFELDEFGDVIRNILEIR